MRGWAASGVGDPRVNVVVFLVFVALTLVIVFRAGRSSRTTSDYYAAGHAFTGLQNGVAISGDYLSAASFLGIAGAIATQGYDGFLYSIGFLVAWLVALLLVAELLRNTGRFTMGDVLSFRMRQPPVRAAAATSTLIVSIVYLIAQMAGAGGLIALLLGVPNTDRAGQGLVIAVVGAVMVCYVLIGGMRGTTWVQIVKAALLLVGATVMSVWVAGRVGFNLSALLGQAVAQPGGGPKLLQAGTTYGTSPAKQLDFLSLALALVLGTAGLPHILMRFYTVPNSREARRSASWAIWLVGIFYLLTLILGYGAAALVGPTTILTAPGKANAAAPLLAYQLGGTLLFGLISSVAFATILAVVAGLTITASASFAHDLYATLHPRGHPSPTHEVRVARLAALAIGALAITGGILANGQNVAFLVALAFAIAASANLPTILYSLFWKRFTTAGALASIYGGLSTCLTLIVISPAVSGSPTAMLPTAHFNYFPLTNPGLISIPTSFLLGYLGTILSPRPANPTRYAEMEVRAITGAGAAR